MFRKTLTILSLIGLLISVGLFAASFAVTISFVYGAGTPAENRGYRIALGGGSFNWFSAAGAHAKYGGGYHVGSRGVQLRYGNIWGTLRLMPYIGFANAVPFSLNIPLWLPILGLGPIVTWNWLLVHRGRKRKKLGLCLKCGYDLRASKDRCPECGAGFSNQGTTQSP